MTVEIPLTHGLVALVDDEDAERVSRLGWHAHRARPTGPWYARSSTRRKVRMHRLVLGVERGQLVDHRNGDGLDNRRANLRIADAAQNAWNRPRALGLVPFKGVRTTTYGTFEARLTLRGRRRFLGTFKTPEKAARAYDAAAVAAFGEFAHVNFPSFGSPGESATRSEQCPSSLGGQFGRLSWRAERHVQLVPTD